ncbi:hypothetical protein GCM10017771_32190 [Streptomyces capitiformicae]|uniref:Uncharacterized protein n=1 Tax=Streptomyces capitiformicae TaxID=2014920 RepID=A0A919L8Q9_9ACTN|nr:hypothetical protein GCM10017771_32190 [Streptomyces capitiformicae]
MRPRKTKSTGPIPAGWTDPGRVVGGVRAGAGGEVPARAEHAHPVPPHGRQMRSTGDEMHIGATAVERGADMGADRTGAENCDFHGEGAPFGRGIPRR